MPLTRALLAVAMCCLTMPLAARTLEVGEGREYKAPSEAITAAKDGDTIDIYPGQYFDCAFVRRSDLVIQGKGAGVIITDKTCGGKGLLVISGDNVTVRNLTLQRARVPDRNGAGIRAEGGNLTVEDTRFVNNENGILSSARPTATIRITGSEFIANGKCTPSCAHGIYINQVALLRVERTKFFETRQAHHIKSRAQRTEVINCDIRDGEEGTSSYLIEAPNGGTLIVDNNTMEKGPKTENAGNAISIGAEGVSQPSEQIIIKNNRFTNDQTRSTTFVNNLTATPAQVIGNVFKGQVRPLNGDGFVR